MDERIRKIDAAAPRLKGDYILYWMRANRRTESNHALLAAAELANRHHKPLLVWELLTCDYPYANDRLHTFHLEGVPETAAALRKLGAGYRFDLQRKRSQKVAPNPAKRAVAVVVDAWPEVLSPLPDLGVETWAVDSSCIVPSACIEGRAYAAYSMRPKIHRILERFLKPVAPVKLAVKFKDAPELPDLDYSRCDIDHSVAPSTLYRGGRKAALGWLEEFLDNRLARYTAEKNEPSAHATSEMSPYLHLGCISALEIALRVREHQKAHQTATDAYLEELIVRRELAFNFAWNTNRVASLEVLPDWVQKTLRAHRKDKRNPVYTRAQFEAAETADGLWNAIQKELLLRGKIHGYYRMYWGKMIIEWSSTHEDALATMLYLNDKYCLDGQDPNTYTNILWCFGLHDRPWGERPVFGNVRYMGRPGLERKTDTKAYIREIEDLERTGKELVA